MNHEYERAQKEILLILHEGLQNAQLGFDALSKLGIMLTKKQQRKIKRFIFFDKIKIFIKKYFRHWRDK